MKHYNMIWKALADPTRRSILDLLKRAPHTTGELSKAFEKSLSRFAVMKHLNVLEKADLIYFRKEGKFRWNYLNTKPFLETYQKWVSNLVQLRHFATSTSDDAMGKLEKQVQSINIELEVHIQATPTKVWKTLTEEIGAWWLKDYFTNSKTKEFILETQLGGMMYESTAKGEGTVWANVISIDAPRSIQLKGLLTPDFGGPAISFIRIDVKRKGKLTTVKLQDQIFGDIEDGLKFDIEDRWLRLFNVGLKSYIERKAS